MLIGPQLNDVLHLVTHLPRFSPENIDVCFKAPSQLVTRPMSSWPPRGWFVADGFEAVADAFQRYVVDDGEIGASFAAFSKGVPIVDIWGGVADSRSGRPWVADTMQIVFSGTKGLVATCLLLLIDRGLLDLEVPVARYWPEFGARGKEAVKVREIVSHAARIPGLTVPVTWEEATDAKRMAELVASQPLSSDPRAEATYHALTFGWICAEVLRRIDGRDVGKFFAEEVAKPLGLEISDRVARRTRRAGRAGRAGAGVGHLGELRSGAPRFGSAATFSLWEPGAL